MPKRGKYFIGEFLHWPSCGEERLAENGNPICMYVLKGQQKLVSKATNPKSFVKKCVYRKRRDAYPTISVSQTATLSSSLSIFVLLCSYHY
jgi:hypothetical protein